MMGCSSNLGEVLRECHSILYSSSILKGKKCLKIGLYFTSTIKLIFNVSFGIIFVIELAILFLTVILSKYSGYLSLISPKFSKIFADSFGFK